MSSDDPYSNRYQPGSGEGRDVGDVGSGEDFGAHIYQLYLAGRVFIPATANLYATNTAEVSRLGATAGALAGLHPTMASVNGLLRRVHHALHRTTTSLHETGAALVLIADDYVATDEAAQDEFRSLFRDDLDLDRNDNSVPPLAPRNLPDPYVEPPGPDSYGDRPDPLGPGLGGL